MTYILNTSLADQPTAQAACSAAGGHLVSWRSLREQQEVEAAFTSRGLLFPLHHVAYWLGLTATDGECDPAGVAAAPDHRQPLHTLQETHMPAAHRRIPVLYAHPPTHAPAACCSLLCWRLWTHAHPAGAPPPIQQHLSPHLQARARPSGGWMASARARAQAATSTGASCQAAPCSLGSALSSGYCAAWATSARAGRRRRAGATRAARALAASWCRCAGSCVGGALLRSAHTANRWGTMPLLTGECRACLLPMTHLPPLLSIALAYADRAQCKP